MQRRKLEMKSRNAHYREVFERLLKYFDSSDILSYSRMDVQVLKREKHYFQAVALKSTYAVDSGAKDDPGKRRNVYICTQSDVEGVKTLEDLPKAWLERFLEMMTDYHIMDDLPMKVKALAASSIEELELKMGILGI